MADLLATFVRTSELPSYCHRAWTGPWRPIIGQLWSTVPSHSLRWNFPSLTVSGNIVWRTYWKKSGIHDSNPLDALAKNVIFMMIGQSCTPTMLGRYYDLAQPLSFGVSLSLSTSIRSPCAHAGGETVSTWRWEPRFVRHRWKDGDWSVFRQVDALF